MLMKLSGYCLQVVDTNQELKHDILNWQLREVIHYEWNRYWSETAWWQESVLQQ